MIKNKILLFILCIQIFACQDVDVVDTQPDNGANTFTLEYPGLINDIDGEVVSSRAATPVNIRGYLFKAGQCIALLSATDLQYNSNTGSIRCTTEGSEESTLYIVTSSNPSARFPEVTLGTTETSFLNLKSSQTDFLTGKVTLNPDQSLLNRTIRLEANCAEIKLSRSSIFNIEQIEIYYASTQSFYFAQNPFTTVSDTVSYKYSASDIPVSDLEFTLPRIHESSNVKVIAYGNIFGRKVSLDFSLPKVQRNTEYLLKLESPGIDTANRKFMIMAVCGESNAVGFDESPADLTGEEAPVPHLYQLGMRTSKDRDFRNNLKVIPMDYCPQDMYDMRARFGGTKKPHFPLGKELLKRIPEGYEVLFIDVTRPSSCVTYEGCRAFFNGSYVSAAHNYGLGFYDSERMMPSNLNALYYWNPEGAFYKMLINRVKYALSLNPENKFLGVMWIQGEDDENPTWVRKHHVEFNKLATAFINDLNNAGFGTRCPRGQAGKHLWYNVATTDYWLRFHLDAYVDWKTWGHGTGQGLFGYYKLWNPDTFVRPPSTAEYTNETNGTGRTANVLPSHYGNGAYAKVVCPMLAECMDQNGGLFNGKTPQNNRYVNQIGSAELQQAGNIYDADVQDGLLVALPLDTPEDVTNNLAHNKTGVTIQNNGLQISNAGKNLPASSGGTRTRNTLKLVNADGKNIKITLTGKNASTGWSATCMVHRTANLGKWQQMILGGGQNSKAPYMAFRKSYKEEQCGSYTEFLASPAMVNKRETTLPGSLFYADRVRSYDEWIHYGVIYDTPTRTMRIFMNGDEVQKHTFDASDYTLPLLSVPLYLGSQNSGNLGMTGEIADFFFWNKPVSDEVLKKVYIRSYWGYEK